MTNRTTNLKTPNDKCMNGGVQEGKKKAWMHHHGIDKNPCKPDISLYGWISYTHSAFDKQNESHVSVCGEGFLSDYFKFVYQINHQLFCMKSGTTAKRGVLCK